MIIFWLGTLVGASSCTPKSCKFDPQSGHTPKLQVQSLVRVCMGGSGSMSVFLSHISPPAPYLPPSLPPHHCKKKKKSIILSSGED